MTLINTIEPNGNSPNGIFKYIFSQNKKLINQIYLSGKPNNQNEQGKETSLSSAVDFSLNQRYLSESGFTEYGIHFSNLYAKITHYSFYFRSIYYFMEDWALIDNTNGKNHTISQGSAVEECGTGLKCKSDVYKVIEISSYSHPITDIIIRMVGTRSDNSQQMEFTNFDIYGSLFEGHIDKFFIRCTKNMNHIRFFHNLFIIFVASHI